VTPRIPELRFDALIPVALVALGAMAVLMGELFLSRWPSVRARRDAEHWIGSALGLGAMLFLAFACAISLGAFGIGGATEFDPGRPIFQIDPFSSLVSAVVTFASLLSCALAIDYLSELRINHGEFYALLLLSTAGMLLMIAAVDLIAVFVGLELLSIPIYVLAGFDRRKLRSNESALKYFLIGSFASAILLYGMALLYGASGSTSFAAIRAGLGLHPTLATLGMGLVLVGFAFKISSVPFHQWTPDVYEGAPSAVTAFMSVTVKATAFAALIRLLGLGYGPLDAPLTNVLWVLAALTMVVGNVMAVIQTNVKRLLAYSSIAHAGYLLLGVLVATQESWAAVVFYLIGYVFMNLGAFGVVVVLAHRGHDCESIDSFAGLARVRPGLAALMTLFMLALAGIPGTVGFFAKFTLFASAIRADFVWLTILAVLTSVVSVYYYLRIPVLMYMRDPGDEKPRLEISTGEGVVLVLCAVVVVFLGIFPNQTLPVVGDLHVLDWSRDSIRVLFGSIGS
jgi:NADH-quinone oxidoreductase subunit N